MSAVWQTDEDAIRDRFKTNAPISKLSLSRRGEVTSPASAIDKREGKPLPYKDVMRLFKFITNP